MITKITERKNITSNLNNKNFGIYTYSRCSSKTEATTTTSSSNSSSISSSNSNSINNIHNLDDDGGDDDSNNNNSNDNNSSRLQPARHGGKAHACPDVGASRSRAGASALPGASGLPVHPAPHVSASHPCYAEVDWSRQPDTKLGRRLPPLAMMLGIMRSQVRWWCTDIVSSSQEV